MKVGVYDDLDLWLEGADIGKKADVELVETGAVAKKEDTGFEEDCPEATVKLPNGETRNWTLNKTCHRWLAKKFGKDPAKWKGQKITLITKAQMVKGKERLCIYPQGEEPAEKAEAKKE